VSNPLRFFLPFRYDSVRTVLLVQSGAAQQLPQIIRRLIAIFPGCSIEVVMREEDAVSSDQLGVAGVEVARYEDRFGLVARLRSRPVDLAVIQLGPWGNRQLRLLPLLLRTRAVIAFNQHLDFFEINVFRIDTLAMHLSGHRGGVAASAATLLQRAIVGAALLPLSVVYLVAVAGWIHLRGAVRRAHRPSTGGKSVLTGAPARR
jgi:hypothetical protein